MKFNYTDVQSGTYKNIKTSKSGVSTAIGVLSKGQ
jgi:hypothetical protein